MKEKGLSHQINSKQKTNYSETKRKADEDLIETAAESLAELLYEQCLMKRDQTKILRLPNRKL